MKYTGNCPKCGSKEIRIVDRKRSHSNHIAAGPGMVAVSLYVCEKCGFIENWVNNVNDLGKIDEYL